jgi:hypothetical protein
MNFIDSLTKTKSTKHIYILNNICYFNRFMISFACKSINVKNVIWFLRLFISMYKTFHAIYCDRDQHFDNDVFRDFLKSYDIVIDYNFFDAFKITDMMKMSNRLLEKIFRKADSNSDSNITWDFRLAKIIKAINERVILYLDISSSAINFEKIQKTSSISSIILHLSSRNIQKWHRELINSLIHCNHVRVYLNHKAKVHDMIQVIIIRRRKNEIARYNREISKMIHHFDDLIMLWQKNTIKLKFKWRDSFKISDYDEFHDIFFILIQLNDRKIRDSFHDDHLKTFTSRTDYLVNKFIAEILSQKQIIKRTRIQKKWVMILSLLRLFYYYMIILFHAVVYSFFSFIIKSRKLLFSSSLSRWTMFLCFS